MSIERPIFWQQGTLLQPQHFQLLERIGEGHLYPYRKYLEPQFWGVGSLKLRKSALGIGSFEVTEGEFLFPDGSFVSVPENGCLAPRSFEGALESGQPLTVYLGLKKWREQGENVSVLVDTPSATATTRFCTGCDPEQVKELHAGGPVAGVHRMQYLLKLFWDTELEQCGEYELIPLAQLDRAGSEIRCSEGFIPPCLCCSASPTLHDLVREVRDQLAARGRQLEEYKAKRSVHGAEFGSRDMVYFLALSVLNRYLPLLFHYTEEPQVHPWQVYGTLRQLVGELSVFSDQVGVLGTGPNRQDALPSYNHRDLWDCFSAAQRLVASLLDEITAGPEYVVGLNYDGRYFSAELKPTIFEGRNRFFLAVRTGEDAKDVLQAVEQGVKLSSPQHLELLVTRSLPGIGLQYLQIPPQELPRRADTLYLAIDHLHEQWSAVVKERSLSLHWTGAPEDLAIEMLVVGR